MIDSKDLWKHLKISRSTFYRKVLPVLKKKGLCTKIGAQYRFDETKVKGYFTDDQEFLVCEDDLNIKPEK